MHCSQFINKSVDQNMSSKSSSTSVTGSINSMSSTSNQANDVCPTPPKSISARTGTTTNTTTASNYSPNFVSKGWLLTPPDCINYPLMIPPPRSNPHNWMQPTINWIHILTTNTCISYRPVYFIYRHRLNQWKHLATHTSTPSPSHPVVFRRRRTRPRGSPHFHFSKNASLTFRLPEINT